jgi:hypothetical protein
MFERFLLSFFIICLVNRVQSVNINGTGSSLAANVYARATFAYQFKAGSDFVSYFSTGSTTGLCNIMG